MTKRSEHPVRYWNSHRHKVSFLGIPKTGSTSIRDALGIHVNRDWTLEPEYERTFAVLREPVNRIKSAYYHLIGNNVWKDTDRYNGFTGFLLRIRDDVESNKGYFNNHCLPQSYYFRPVTKVFVIEQPGPLCAWLGIPKLEQANVYHGQRVIAGPYEIEMIKQLYTKDFELYETYKDTVTDSSLEA